MKRLPSLLLAAALLLSASTVCVGQTPVVENSVPDVTVPLGTPKTKVKFTNTFALAQITGPVVRFDTTEGFIDVGLLSGDAPATVQNFMNYVNRGAYAGTFIHRSVANFVIQGGGYTHNGGEVAPTSSHPAAFIAPHIPTDPPVINEFKNSNTRGTIAMAKTSDPNSATSEWFFNTQDNSSSLNNASNSGGFTVFGRVLAGGLATMDGIAARPVIDAYGLESDGVTPYIDFSTLPAGSSYTDPKAAVYGKDLVTVRRISPIPLIVPSAGAPGVLKLKLKGNTNPRLVPSAVFAGKKLTLTFAPGVTGSSTITVAAKDAAKNKATTSFVVTVR